MENLLDIGIGGSVVAYGAALLALGYKIVRFHALTISVALFAALGCAAGALAGSPFLAMFMTVAGAAIGYLLGPALYYVTITLAAATGGVVIGAVLSMMTGYSNPYLLMVATAAGTAVIALLNAKLATISWTSAAGAATATLGIFWASYGGKMMLWILDGVIPAGPYAWRAGVVFAVLCAAGVAFQFRTTAEKVSPPVETAPASA